MCLNKKIQAFSWSLKHFGYNNISNDVHEASSWQASSHHPSWTNFVTSNFWTASQTTFVTFIIEIRDCGTKFVSSEGSWVQEQDNAAQKLIISLHYRPFPSSTTSGNQWWQFCSARSLVRNIDPSCAVRSGPSERRAKLQFPLRRSFWREAFTIY